MIAADAILAAHVAIILFNLFGLVAVPLGAVCHWRFVRIRWWRVVHILLLAAVAVQALAGRACILTLWQADLAGGAADRAPLIARSLERAIYWPLPIWVFAALYIASSAMRWRCFGWCRRGGSGFCARGPSSGFSQLT